MTKTTEELKREMYKLLAALNACKKYGEIPYVSLPDFEAALEAYLEALRKEQLATDNRVAFLESLSKGALEQLEICGKHRDEYRNKLQAFQFANKSAGELLRDALATVKRQREYIRTLYTSRKARKIQSSTSAQSSSENVAGDELKRFDGHSCTTSER